MADSACPVPTDAGLFVAGTDTGVGKTVVTAGLTAMLREDGIDAHAVKPVQTGAPEDDDAAYVARVCGDPDAATCLRRLEPPLAPRVAADIEDDSLEYDAILGGCQRAVTAVECAVVEGVGGLRVPLAGDDEVLDLVEALELPAIVVACSDLGTLNHTALTVEALRDRGCPVVGVILNRYEGDTLAERTNPDELRRMLECPVTTMAALDVDDPEAVVTGVRSALSTAGIEGLDHGL